VKGFPTEGNVVGCDYAGVVEDIGKGASTDLQVGDRVAGIVHGACHRNGAFAEYVVVDPELAVGIPNSWTFEEAAQVPVAGFTTCMALYYAQTVPTPLAPAACPIDVLVWGGATAVGQYVVQAARGAGLRVLATCSPKNFALVASLGAHEVLDYRDEQTPSKIKDLTKNKLAHVVDCVSEGDTGEKIEKAIGDEGGEVSTLLPYKTKREDVKFTFVLGYMLTGKPIEIPFTAAADLEQYAFGKKAAKLLTDLLAAGKLRPGPIKLMPKGLASVEEGFEYMLAGKVSGEKIIYRIADTPK